MRVLLIFPVHRDKKFGGPPVNVNGSVLSLGQPQLSWWKALNDLGHEVRLEAFDRWPGEREQGPLHVAARCMRKVEREAWQVIARRKSRVRLKHTAKELRPEVVLISGGHDLVPPGWLCALQERDGAVVVLLHGAPPRLMGTRSDRQIARFARAVVTNSSTCAREWGRIGAKCAITLPLSACDPGVHGAVQRQASPALCDVAFVGSLDRVLYHHRLNALKALNGFDLGIWSVSGEEVLQKEGLLWAYRGPSSRIESAALYARCKIVVNIHGEHMLDGGNLSTFEIPGSGGFQLVDAVDFRWFRPGTEVETFSGIEALREKIKLYLREEGRREEIACAGRRRALADHTYHRRFEVLFRMLDLKRPR